MTKPTSRLLLTIIISCAISIVAPHGDSHADKGSMKIDLELLPTDPSLPRGKILRSLPRNQRILIRHVHTDSRPVSKKRNPEISEEHLLIVAYDSHGKEIIRTLVPDSRIVRAETVNISGELVSEKLFRQEANLTVHIPNTPGIYSLRIFQPRWNGVKFVLEPINDVRLPKSHTKQ